MYSINNIHRVLSIRTCLFSVFFALFFLLQMPNLEASGFGDTGKVDKFQGITWNKVYFDMNNLKFKASVPNLISSAIEDNNVLMYGKISDLVYLIFTPLDSKYQRPKSINEFVRILENNNPNHYVSIVKSKTIGTKYIADLSPKNESESLFLRFIATNNHIMILGTDEPDETRRLYFFDSIRIEKKK